MAFSDSQAIARADINAFVEEAMFMERMLIGTKVMPPFGADAMAGQYPKFRLGKGELLNDDAQPRALTSAYNRVTRVYELDTYTCVDRGLEEVVDDVYAKDMRRFFDAEVAAGRQVLRQVMIGHEVRVAAAIINTANFTATAAAVNYTAALKATIDFPGDILGAIDRLNAKGVEPNSIILSGPVASRIKVSTLFQNFVRGNLPSGQPVTLTDSDIARGFGDLGIINVFIGRGQKNSAKKGQPFVGVPIWPNTHIWVGYVAGGDFMLGGAGRTIVWNPEGGIFVSESYREEFRRSNIVRVRQNTDEKIVDPTAGELITTNFA